MNSIQTHGQSGPCPDFTPLGYMDRPLGQVMMQMASASEWIPLRRVRLSGCSSLPECLYYVQCTGGSGFFLCLSALAGGWFIGHAPLGVADQ